MANLGTPDFMKDENLIREAIGHIKINGYVALTDLFVSKQLNTETLDRLTTKICESGLYFQDINAHTKKWVIKKNPNFKKVTFRERQPLLYDGILAILSALLSLFVGWLLLRSNNQTQYLIDKRQDSAITGITVRLDTLQKHK
jgi:hypothetical protein